MNLSCANHRAEGTTHFLNLSIAAILVLLATTLATAQDKDLLEGATYI